MSKLVGVAINVAAFAAGIRECLRQLRQPLFEYEQGQAKIHENADELGYHFADCQGVLLNGLPMSDVELPSDYEWERFETETLMEWAE